MKQADDGNPTPNFYSHVYELIPNRIGIPWSFYVTTSAFNYHCWYRMLNIVSTYYDDFVMQND